MANRFSSPCPTSHDTPGQSGFLATPLGSALPRRKSLPHIRTSRKSISTPHPMHKSRIPVRESPKKPTEDDQGDSEVNLTEYTFDLNKLPGELVSIGKEDGEKKKKQQKKRHDSLDEKISLQSDTEGPEDFTLNMVELLKNVDLEDTQRTEGHNGGGDKDKDGEGEGDGDQDDGRELDGPTRATGLQDYTQLDHTLETSTPAHLLWRDVDASLMQASSPKNQPNMATVDKKASSLKESSIIYTPKRKCAPTTPTAEVSQVEDTVTTQQEDQTLCAAQQICQLELDLEAKTRRIREMEGKLAQENPLLKQVNELKRQLQRRDEKTKLTDTEISDLRKTKFELEQARGEIANQASKESTLRSNLKEKSRQLKEAEKALEEANVKHQRHAEELGTEVKQAKQECEKQLGGVYSLRYQLTSTTRERDSLQKQTEDHERVVEDLKTRLTAVDSQKADEAAESLARLREVQKFAGELALPALGKPFFEIVNLLREHVKTITEKSSEQQKEHSKESDEAQRELKRLLKKSSGAARLEARKAELYRDQLSDASSKLDSVKNENTELLGRIAVLTCDNAKLNKRATETSKEHDQAISALRKLRAEAEESHKSQIASLKSSHSEQLAKHRNNKQGPSSELQARLAASKTRESVLTAELRTEKEARERLEEEIVRMEAEIAHHHMTQQRLEAIIKANTSAAKKIDGKIIDIMREREESWKARIDELVQDNDRLAKALMAMWGKHEVSDLSKLKGSEKGDKQGYKYKYVKKAQDVEIKEIWIALMGEPAT
ncbi:hypothetical protein FQN49_003293 [Arthroderma sp. PD_2]|nr:hypothetical protein FQN49_003293 [Arthroderma sp. PD_2]